jgi:endonuclease/exonuclease/phosphatase family metal-dependent hydrolase
MIFLSILAAIVLVVVLLGFLLWWNADHPKDGSKVPVFCKPEAPQLRPGQKLKVMTYNIQFLAGKNYVFFFDTPDYSGPDGRVEMKDIISTADGISRVIIDEAPDIIFLQEVDDGSRRTNYQDQLALLLSKLPEEYGCYTSAFYWKLKLVPHPKLFGSLGMKTAIISKYKITEAERYNLPVLPVGFVLQQVSGQKLILQALLPVEDGSQIAVMSTHLDAFTIGSDIMTKQLNRLRAQIKNLDLQNIPWILGGDFNLLPPGQYEQLIKSHQSYYNANTEIENFYEEANLIPSLKDVSGADAKRWFTFFGNDPRLDGPDRTLDYLVYSEQLRLVESYVRQTDTQKLSDHLPVFAVFEI